MVQFEGYEDERNLALSRIQTASDTQRPFLRVGE
jgi:hypothetical protein